MIRLLRSAIWIGAAIGVAKAVKSLGDHMQEPTAPAAAPPPPVWGFESFSAEEQDMLLQEMDASF